LLTSPLVTAQTGKDKDQPVKDPVEKAPAEVGAGKNLQPIKMGYTRPGYPNDVIKDGTVIPVASDEAYKGRMIGGSIYFAVYQRVASPAAGDTFGTGIANFDDMFREGTGINGGFSPAFDTSARYLYVYQVVNDRGLDPPKDVVPAAFRNIRSEDLITSSIKLLVDPRDITSWGHFENAAFASTVVDRTLRGEIVLAADKITEKTSRIAYSSNPSILASLPFHKYMDKSPAYPLRNLEATFGVDQSTVGLKKCKSYEELVALKKNKIELVNWQDNMLVAAEGGKAPTYVQIVVPEYEQYGTLPLIMPGQDQAAPLPRFEAIVDLRPEGSEILESGYDCKKDDEI